MRYFCAFLLIIPIVFTSPSKRFLIDAFGDGIAIENISQWAACNPGMTNDTCNAVCPKIIRWSFYCGLACSTVLRRIETGSFSKNCTTI
ncbi:Hypothetical predicted protein [Mytilus galloprovincialis]|uniref:Uncharacterized protein n=1 Tax=Mytilus galloprovincialis TaxID=29158 RepID=A0A8B6GN11_MYTGA|nr:Hypothetical predicted protein [Mytilus galloprovincialis]